MRRMLPPDVQGFDAGGPPRPRAGDWILAALVAAVSVAEVLLRDDMTWPVPALGVGLLLASTMLFRRQRPLTAIVVAAISLALADVISIAVTGTPIALNAGFFVLVLVYSVSRWADTLAAAIGLGVVAVLWGVAVTTDNANPEDTIGGALILLLAFALGLAVRYRAIIWSQQVERIRSLERENLARELHDTVAHHVSGIAVQAQAGRVLASTGNADGAVAALTIIEQEASRTLVEMRSMVMTLRRDDGAPGPSLPHGVDDILAMATPAGSALSPVVEVEQHGDLDGVRPAVLMALHRVAQEAVTNARRHAHPTRVHVRLDGDRREVRVAVTDDGASVPSLVQPPGYGIVGMTERVTLLGGSLRAGALPEGGWRVEAVIPRDGANR